MSEKIIDNIKNLLQTRLRFARTSRSEMIFIGAAEFFTASQKKIPPLLSSPLTVIMTI